MTNCYSSNTLLAMVLLRVGNELRDAMPTHGHDAAAEIRDRLLRKTAPCMGAGQTEDARAAMDAIAAPGQCQWHDHDHEGDG